MDKLMGVYLDQYKGRLSSKSVVRIDGKEENYPISSQWLLNTGFWDIRKRWDNNIIWK